MRYSRLFTYPSSYAREPNKRFEATRGNSLAPQAKR